MINVYLSGVLGKEFGRKHSFNVKSFREIVDALNANFSNFRIRLMQLMRSGYSYTIQHGAARLDPSAFNAELTDFVVISPKMIVNDPVTLSVAMSALAAAGAAIAEYGLFAAATGAFLGMTTAVWIGLAVSFAIGGVLALLAPSMELPSGLGDVATIESATSSFYAGGDFKLVTGAPMPFGYGKMLVKGTVISTIIDTVRI
jgi:predicted phage tail protein